MKTNKNDVITITWHIVDVIERAREIFDIELKNYRAREILQLTLAKHDCNIGINWEVIDVWIEFYCNENNIKIR
jgi:hypothetical protein